MSDLPLSASSIGGETPYISNGRNPNWESTCLDCIYRYPDPQSWSHGWCIKHNYASVGLGYCLLFEAIEAK